MLNPRFHHAYALAKAIKHSKTPEGKKRCILKWCEITKAAIGAKQ